MNPLRIGLLLTVLLWFAAVPAALADGIAGLGRALPGGRLDAQRGGSDTVLNDMHVNGTVRDNTATHNITGNNTISNAFTGASGLPIVVQNSGNNVLIQNATIVNLQVQ